jgi:beta-glucanase (GH16 family)
MYGRFVTRMAGPAKKGTVASFFTYVCDNYPHDWNEIDIELVPSMSNNPFSMNIIWEDGKQDHNYAAGFDPKGDFNTYVIEWTPHYVAWFINDHLVRKTENTDDVYFLHQPTQIMMNFWTPTWYPWNDQFSEADLPWETKYDYVETYTWNDYTNSFDWYWRDDFNSFDNSKWYASDNWGFEGNSSLFVAS